MKHESSKDDSKNPSRRQFRRKDFLKWTLFSFAAAGSLESAAGQVGRQIVGRKPPLTSENLNKLLGELSRGRRDDLKALATSDWRAALRQEFALTPQQEAMLGAVTPNQVADVQKAINDSLAANRPMLVRPAPAPGPNERTKVTCGITTDGMSCTFTCTVVIGPNRSAEGQA